MIVAQGVPQIPIVQTDNRTSPFTSHSSVNFGATAADRWIIVLAFHGNALASPGHTPTATIGGVSATRIAARSTGDGVAKAVGVALFVAQPSGTLGTVAVTWGSLPTTIIVLRVVGYNLAVAHDSDASSITGTFSINIPTNGLLIGSMTGQSITWTGLTERLEDFANSKFRNYGWDYNMPLQTGRSVSYTPFSSSLGDNAALVASFARA